VTETTSARDRLIQQVWRVVRNIDEATVHAYPSAARAIQAGAAASDLVPP
jgi:alkylated DNA nucleotide flippase Atl1